jgi:hypothetical protein
MFRFWNASTLLPLIIGICILSRIAEPSESLEACRDEDYAIFSAATKVVVIPVLLLDHTEKTEYVLSIPIKNHWSKQAQEFNDNVPKDAIEDFDARNKSRAAFDGAKIEDHSRIIPLSDKESEMFDQDGVTKLQKKYGTEINTLTFSRPGINRDHNRAILYVTLSYEFPQRPFWGEGMYVLLSKDNGSWKVMKTLTMWQV